MFYTRTINFFLFMFKRQELLCSLVMKVEQDARMGNHLGVYREGVTIMDTKNFHCYFVCHFVCLVVFVYLLHQLKNFVFLMCHVRNCN